MSRAKIYRALPHHEPRWLSKDRGAAEAETAQAPHPEAQSQNSNLQDKRCS